MTARTRKAAYLRRCGLTYKEIGERLGVGKARAHQMVAAFPLQERRRRYALAEYAVWEIEKLVDQPKFYAFLDRLKEKDCHAEI